MADTKISALTPASTLNNSDYLLLVQGGNSLKIDIQTFLSHIPSKMAVLEASESPSSGVLSTGLLVSKLTASAPNVDYTMPAGSHGMEKQIVVASVQNSVKTILSTTWAASVVTVTTAITQTVTSATWTAGVVTVTATAHGFTSGNSITMAGFTPSGYNGSFVITVTGANTFTYNLATNPGATTTVGTATIGIAHGFTTNNSIVISGITPSGYDGTFVITTSNPNTFTYPLTSNPGAVTVEGIATNLGSAALTVASGASGFSKLTFTSLQSTAWLKNIDGMWYVMSSNSVSII